MSTYFKMGDKVVIDKSSMWYDEFKNVVFEITDFEEDDTYVLRNGSTIVLLKEMYINKITDPEADIANSFNNVTTKKFTDIALEIGKFTDMKNEQYGSSVDAVYKIMEVLMERYTYDEENYLMPKSLLKHILLQVRMMDKQNRIFNNPEGKNDEESQYNDLAGYSLIGIDMVNNK